MTVQGTRVPRHRRASGILVRLAGPWLMPCPAPSPTQLPLALDSTAGRTHTHVLATLRIRLLTRPTTLSSKHVAQRTVTSSPAPLNNCFLHPNRECLPFWAQVGHSLGLVPKSILARLEENYNLQVQSEVEASLRPTPSTSWLPHRTEYSARHRGRPSRKVC